MRKFIVILSAIVFAALASRAQTVLTLDSCRAMAISNNKQLNTTELKQQAAEYAKKAVRTKYLPRVEALGSYQYFSKEISILSDEQQAKFAGIGNSALGKVGETATQSLTNLVQGGIISPSTAQDLGQLLNVLGQPLAQVGNQIGQEVNDAFKTNTHNIFAGSVLLSQPIYMGGAIRAANKMADIAYDMAAFDKDGNVQSTIYEIDKTYWLVVSLTQKKKLAESYKALVDELNKDVHKLINEGLATKADGLKVDVKSNEVDMSITMVDNGLSLSKMLLCQLCGLPLDSQIVLTDENSESVVSPEDAQNFDSVTPRAARHEIQLLESARMLSEESAKLIRAPYLPQVLLTGGYMVSNPNVFNGFDNKFAGVWNVGVTVRIPIWSWREGEYKVKAAKIATEIAAEQLSDADEKINLQVSQCRFQVNEAIKRYEMSLKNLENAEENLRCANVGFKEGMIESREVMMAQAAWQAAQSQKIDAEINVKLTQVNLKKALGILQ